MIETQKERGDTEEIPTKISDENGVDLRVQDSSLDYKGRVALRASTGSWKASSFIIIIEVAERLSHFGLLTNLITYMTKVMHQDLVTAANSVNLWSGVTTVIPLLGGFLADAYTGRYLTVLFSSILYFLGLGIFTMSQYIPSLKPCGATSSTCQHVNNNHKVVFFIAAYIISLATGGYKPCLQSFGADQFDDNNSNERKQKMSFFNWWGISVCTGLFIGVTLIVYVEDYVSWGIAFMILAIAMGLSILIFLIGRPFYRYKTPRGSPLTPLLQVMVAALAKRNLTCPSDASLLYENTISSNRLLVHTDRFRFLDKAAIIESQEVSKKKQNPWRLATVTQVEELKLIITMFPIWLTCLVFGIGLSQGITFFVKQSSATNRKLSSHFEIPAASMNTLIAIGMILSIALYDKVLVPYLRRTTGNERGMNILTRIGIGMVILIIAMLISALVENKRINAHLQAGRTISVFWLAPQFFIMGVGDAFSLIGMQEYFYDQVPDSMRSIGMAFYLSILGVGTFLGSFLIMIINLVTSVNGGKQWIGKDINHSRLDYYYWFLTIIFVLNMCAYVFLANNYSYKNVKRDVVVDNSCDGSEKIKDLASV